jgi:hypothetical protein
MRVVSWAIAGALLINVAFALIVAVASEAARAPARAAAHAPLAHCASGSMPDSPAHRVASHYLAAVRMGWAIG